MKNKIFKEVKVYEWDNGKIVLKDLDRETSLANIALDFSFDGCVVFNCDGEDLLVYFEEDEALEVKTPSQEEIERCALA